MSLREWKKIQEVLWEVVMLAPIEKDIEEIVRKISKIKEYL
jgi:hypothetical protein